MRKYLGERGRDEEWGNGGDEKRKGKISKRDEENVKKEKKKN